MCFTEKSLRNLAINSVLRTHPPFNKHITYMQLDVHTIKNSYGLTVRSVQLRLNRRD